MDVPVIARVRAARQRRKMQAGLATAQAGASTDLRLAEIPLREMV